MLIIRYTLVSFLLTVVVHYGSMSSCSTVINKQYYTKTPYEDCLMLSVRIGSISGPTCTTKKKQNKKNNAFLQNSLMLALPQRLHSPILVPCYYFCSRSSVNTSEKSSETIEKDQGKLNQNCSTKKKTSLLRLSSKIALKTNKKMGATEPRAIGSKSNFRF